MAFQERAILSTLNATVTQLNQTILQWFLGVLWTYNAVNSADVNEGSIDVDEIPIEHLQSINLLSLLPLALELKIGIPIMLLRNLYPQEGLCNRTWMVVTNLWQHCLESVY